MRSIKTMVFTLSLLGLAIAQASAAEVPSLAGTWVPDAAASSRTKELKKAPAPDAPPAPPAPSAAILEKLPGLRIVHAEPRLKIDFLETDGSVISTTEITTDGKENVNSRVGGALTHRSTSTWDGQVLKTSWSLVRGSAVVISGVDLQELTSPDTLVVTTTTEDSKSRSKSRIVYQRQR